MATILSNYGDAFSVTHDDAVTHLNVRVSSRHEAVFPDMGIPMLKIRRSRDRLIFDMGILILIRRHLYIEKAPDILDDLHTPIFKPIAARDVTIRIVAAQYGTPGDMLYILVFAHM